MDEMKRNSEIGDALREIAKQRDKGLDKSPVLSAVRQALLTDFLVREFPIEAALREAARKRDQLLHLPRSGVSASAESILHRQLSALQAAAGLDSAPRKLDGLKPSSLSMQQFREDGVHIPDLADRIPAWLWFFRSPPGIALAACAVIMAGVLSVGTLRTSSRDHSVLPNTAHVAEIKIEWETQLFTRKASIGPFNLNTNEPASLQAWFLANRSVRLADGIEAPLGLRLDLPVRAMLVEDALARTP
jgi:hypothetical protein